MLGRDGSRIAEAQSVEFGQGALLRTDVHLVRRQHHGPAPAPEDPRDLEVERGGALASVDHEQHEVRLVDGGEHLTADSLDQGLLG